MKTGNKKQVILLSVVAIGAIAFLVYQLLPSKIRPAFGQPVARPASEPAVDTDFGLALIGDPFSHPKLAVKPVAVSNAAPVEIDKSGYNPFHIPGLLDATVAPDLGSNPAENAGAHRQKPQGPQITVVAVMHAGSPVAMLEVNGKEAKSFNEGDLIAPNARLISIGESSVSVRVNGEMHELSTGDSYGSKTEEKDER